MQFEETMYPIILHATDLSQYHFKLSQQAASIAKSFHAKLYLLHVIEPPASLQLAQGLGFAEFDKPVKDNAQTVMDVLGDALGVPRERLLVEVGSTKHQILTKAEELGCSLIIIGSHTPTHLPSFLGGTAHAVVNHAKCDVLTLRVE
jgi:nucleotide-binding universal stress UspA family protein